MELKGFFCAWCFIVEQISTAFFKPSLFRDKHWSGYEVRAVILSEIL